MWTEEEELKVSLRTGDTVFYIENPKESTKERRKRKRKKKRNEEEGEDSYF